MSDVKYIEGDFDSEYTGKGKLTFPNGDVYEGDFANGKLKVIVYKNHAASPLYT